MYSTHVCILLTNPCTFFVGTLRCVARRAVCSGDSMPQTVSLSAEERTVILDRIKQEVNNAQQQNEAAFNSLNNRLHALEAVSLPNTWSVSTSA